MRRWFRLDLLTMWVVMSLICCSVNMAMFLNPSHATKGMPIASSRSLDGDELLRIGDIHEVQRHWQEALPYYQRALTTFRDQRRRKGEALALLKISHVLHQSGRPDDALIAINQCIGIVSKTRWSKMHAQALMQRGLIDESLERWTEARASYEKADSLFVRAHDREGSIDARIRHGILLENQGEFDEGLRQLQQTYGDAQQFSLGRLQMTALLGIAKAHIGLEDSNAARQTLEEGRTIAHRLQDLKQEAVFSLQLARLHQTAGGEYSRSRVLAQHALTLYQSIRDLLGEADALSSLGTLALNENDKEEALARHQQALELYRALRDRAREAGTLTNLGLVYESQASIQLAHEMYGKAIFLLQSLAEPPSAPVSRF